MEIPKLKFTKLWTNHDDFPTVETREEVVRSDMQLLFNEIRDYINTTLSGVVSTIGDTLTALQGKAGAGRIGFTRTAAIDRDNVQDAIERVQEQLVSVSQGGIADGAVTSEKVAAGAIGTAAIADAAVTYDKIKDKAVGSAKLADNAVSAKKIASNAVQERQIFDGSVTQSKLAAESVSSAKLAPNAVTGEKIADRAINSEKMGDASVPERALCAGAVTNAKVNYKALGEEISVTPSFAKSDGTASVNSCVFRYVKAIGVMLFQIELLGLSQQEAASGVSLTFSGLDKLPSEDAGFAAVVQVLSATGSSGFALASAYFTRGGGLRIVYPDDVSTGDTVITSLSGWYFC